MKKKILLTGSTGFIGFNIARLLVKEDYQLRLLVRKEIPLNGYDNVEYVFGDIRSYEDVLNAVSGCDIVIHTAGLFTFSPKLKKEIYEINVTGTENICRAALASSVERVIYTSSAATIGKSEKILSDENTSFNLWKISSHYKKSKVLSEDVVLKYYKDYSLPVIILNPSLPLGRFDFKPTSTGAMVESFIKSRNTVYINGGFNFVHVEDVAKAHVLSIHKGSFGERYIIGNENIYLKDFYYKLNEFYPKNKIIRIPYVLALVLSYVNVLISLINGKEPRVTPQGVRLSRKKMFYDNSKSKKELGLVYKPIEEGLKDSLNWFKTEKYGYRKDS